MSRDQFTVAVTGLNATDNPGPGMGVIRAIREHPDFNGRIVGLVYDNLEPGIYTRRFVDDAFLIPALSEGRSVFEDRLRQIHERMPFDVVIPNLDAELPRFIALESKLAELGVGMFLPTEDLFEIRSKARLEHLGKITNIAIPRTEVLAGPDQLRTIGLEIGYPLWIKGARHGAIKVYNPDEAIAAYHQMVAAWGAPVLAQANVDGDEIGVVAVGDGRGETIGAVPMRKWLRTDKGKGWVGITIGDPSIDELSRRYMAATCWRGPCEIEMVRTRSGEFHLIEINPRFPAWCYLSAGAGMNLPYAVTRLAAGLPVDPMTDYRVGTMFVRISLDLLVPLECYQSIATTGELRSTSPEVSHE